MSQQPATGQSPIVWGAMPPGAPAFSPPANGIPPASGPPPAFQAPATQQSAYQAGAQPAFPGTQQYQQPQFQPPPQFQQPPLQQITPPPQFQPPAFSPPAFQQPVFQQPQQATAFQPPAFQQPAPQQPAPQQPAPQQPAPQATVVQPVATAVVTPPPAGPPAQQAVPSYMAAETGDGYTRSLFDPKQAAQAQAPTQQVQPPTQQVQTPTQQVQQPPPQAQVPTQPAQVPTQQATPVDDSAPTIQQLLREFAKLPECDRYSGDAEKVKLLTEYLWLRQLTPGLSFETFLTLYAAVANFDETNLKHPADSIRYHLPRTQKAATERGIHHWAAKEVVDYVALYVDVIREAEKANSPIPLTLNQFLTSAPMIQQFLAGAFKEVAPPKSQTPKQPRAAKSETVERPSAVGQRVIYTTTSNRQYRGVLTAYWVDPGTSNAFADFRTDAGEDFKGIGIDRFTLCTDPKPNAPQTVAGSPLPEISTGKLLIPKAQYPSVVQVLGLPVACGTVAIGDVIYPFHYQYPTGHVAVVNVVNGANGPYVDACLCFQTPENIVAEINQPRKNIDGLYTFETPDGTFNLEITGNQ